MGEKRIYLLTKYTRAGASSRYRTFQYLPAMQQAGFQCQVSPLFDDAYLAHKYTYGRARLIHVLRAFARRILCVLRLPRGSVVVIEKELLPYFPALFERFLIWRGCRIIVDYDDALFHQYDRHTKTAIRRLLGGKVATVMRLADTVVAGNAYLADYARRAGARRVEIIPTVVDLMRYPKGLPTFGSQVFTIGWIGSPSTARYLVDIAPALAEVCKEGRARVRLVGSGPIALPGVPAEILAWNEDSEVDQIRCFDVGIMPLPDQPWARGKCGFKLIQYMACGLPVVASPVGVNAELVQEGENGSLAATGEEWINALQLLRDDMGLRRNMGVAGRARVEAQYCLAHTAPRIDALLLELNQG